MANQDQKKRKREREKKGIPRLVSVYVSNALVTVSVPVGVTIHSLRSGIEHHRLVGLKPVVEFIETTLFGWIKRRVNH